MLIKIGDLAVQAIMAFVGIDNAILVDSTDFTFIGAYLARLATFLAPF